MRPHGEAVTSRDLLLQALDRGLFEFRDRAAFDADEVVVVVVVVRDLVPRDPVAEATLVSDTALGEQLQRPIDGRIADPRVDRADLRQELVDRDVRRRLEERLDDDTSLLGRT